MSNRTPTPAERERTASAVADFCLLDDPRSVLHRTWNRINPTNDSVNDLSEKQCIRRQISGKASLEKFSMPAEGSAEYNLIVARAEALAALRDKQCLVRDFNDDNDVPQRYFGYRGSNGKCQVTHDESVARSARSKYPQSPR